MMWDYAEANPFSGAGGDIFPQIEYVSKYSEMCSVVDAGIGNVSQADAQNQQLSLNRVVSTDPPYYDNIGYADLSDFFYVWLRRCLRSTYPQLLSTISVPKSDELIASPFRHGSKEEAEKFFLDGMTRAMKEIAIQCHPAFPITIYYAFKQSDSTLESGTSSTGWETFLDAVNSSGLQLSGTWPVRTERVAAFKTNVNALASSIVLVCRPRVLQTLQTSRRDFIRSASAKAGPKTLVVTMN